MGKPVQFSFVVVDTMGAGRPVGVFDTEAAAMAVVDGFPEYYKVHRCPRDGVTAEAVGWARSEEQRKHLARFVRQ